MALLEESQNNALFYTQSISSMGSHGSTTNLQKPPQPPPSPALSLRDKMNSLKRFIHPSNRPLPDPPEQKIHCKFMIIINLGKILIPLISASNSSLDTISKRSTSVGANKSVSSTMEKIQNNTAATLDRMTMLQQRYRQHQETMKSEGDRSRRASLTSNADLQVWCDWLRECSFVSKSSKFYLAFLLNWIFWV